MVTVPFKAKEAVPSHKEPSAPAITTAIGLIWMVKKSETITGQTPFPTAVRVTVTVPVAPALGTITGLKVFSVPAKIVAAPETLQEYRFEFCTLAPETV